MSQISHSKWVLRFAAIAGLAFTLGSVPIVANTAQTNVGQPTPAAPVSQTRLTDQQLNVLVARIALYPDDLLALVASASLYPVQIVDAARYLKKAQVDKSLKPKSSWDDSVISLLNYPDIVEMMNEDLDWTQALSDAIANQQEDVLKAIQRLRGEAETKGIIKTDDKIKVVRENNNVVIQSASTEVIYVPRYEPQMLYEPSYAVAPIDYYPDPYPYYYYPTAPYFAGLVTGAFWGATISWANNGYWGPNNGIWGGRWNGNDIKIDCNKCFNNINGRIGLSDVDWRNVDRSKIGFDRNQFNNVNRANINRQIESNRKNNIGSAAQNIRNSADGRRINSKNNIGNRDVRDRKNDVGKRNAVNDNRSKMSASNRTTAKNARADNKRSQKGKANANTKRSKNSSVKNRNRQSPSSYNRSHNRKPSHMNSSRGRQSMNRSHHRGGHPRPIPRGRGGRR